MAIIEPNQVQKGFYMQFDDLSFEALKRYQREHRKNFPDNLGLRVHRAISWLQKAEQARQAKDFDTEFIYYWISFNATYANDFGDMERPSEKDNFGAFLTKVAQLDDSGVLYELIWQKFSSSIRLLMDNRYVYQPFWDFLRGRLTELEWQQRFSSSKATVNKALAEKDVPKALVHIFMRLYTLRNQVIHGGSTFNSQVNREQLKDACNLLNKLVPMIVALMMSKPDQEWGPVCYPVVNE